MGELVIHLNKNIKWAPASQRTQKSIPDALNNKVCKEKLVNLKKSI